MAEINWNLLQVPDIGQSFQQGYQQGRQRNALAAYAQNPDDPQSLNALAEFNPELVLQAKRQQQQQAFEQQKLQAQYGQKRDDDRKAYVGQAALRIAQLPPDQRAVAWDQAAAQGAAMGHPELASYQGKYSDELLNATLAAAGLTNEAMQAQQPKYMPIPAGGTLVDTRNPQAVQAFSGGQTGIPKVTDEASYGAIKPGQKYMTPDGHIRIKGGVSGNTGATFRP